MTFQVLEFSRKNPGLSRSGNPATSGGKKPRHDVESLRLATATPETVADITLVKRARFITPNNVCQTTITKHLL